MAVPTVTRTRVALDVPRILVSVSEKAPSKTMMATATSTKRVSWLLVNDPVKKSNPSGPRTMPNASRNTTFGTLYRSAMSFESAPRRTRTATTSSSSRTMLSLPRHLSVTSGARGDAHRTSLRWATRVRNRIRRPPDPARAGRTPNPTGR
jgi:hypothetical protein